MGSKRFEATGFGKTLKEAFDACVANAQWSHGDTGGTGTIAEKEEVEEVVRPRGVRISGERVMEMVEKCAGLRYAPTRLLPQEILKRMHSALKAGGVNPKMWDAITQAAVVYDDPCLPAVAVRANGSEEAEYRKARGLKRRRGSVWFFGGRAST